MIFVNSSELAARFQTQITYLWFVYGDQFELETHLIIHNWCFDSVLVIKPLSSAGWLCWPRILQFGDVHLPAGAESQMARPHHASTGKPREQTDHSSLWLLWWDFFTCGRRWSVFWPRCTLRCHKSHFLNNNHAFLCDLKERFFFLSHRWVPDQVWECKCLALLHQSVRYVNSCSCKYWSVTVLFVCLLLFQKMLVFSWTTCKQQTLVSVML